MTRSPSLVELSVLFAVGGSVLAVGVPAFLQNLSASKLTEPLVGLDRMVKSAVSYAETRSQDICFPPSAPLTPAQVPRGMRARDPADAWEHLTWRSLDFRFEDPHAFSFKFDSAFDPSTQIHRFAAVAHGDLDGDGMLSTFEVRGERLPGQTARVLGGMYVDREVE